MIRRAGAVALLAAALALEVGGVAAAHALYRTSSPTNGADLKQAPTRIDITFTERPDPRISVIQVLDTTGHNHTLGQVQPVPGQPLELQTAVGSLPAGVYTVIWRTVSEADRS